MTDLISNDSQPPAGQLTPYLSSDGSDKLARQVLSALPPSRFPSTAAELKCFGGLINKIAASSVPKHLRIKCALTAWPYARFPEKESYFAQAQLLPNCVQIDDYEFITIKDFDTLVSSDHHGRHFGYVVNGCTILRVTSVTNPLSTAMLAIAILPNLARPMDPCLWSVCAIDISSNAPQQIKLRRITDSMIYLLNDVNRPYD